ncbi:MAG: tyrosine-type recombinase/integrase [Candidatus Bathyarchaeia archaeon]
MGKAEGNSEINPYHLKTAERDDWTCPQPPKSRPKRPENLKCPECGGERLFRDGLRRLADGSVTQRWLCRECGYRFSENRLEKAGGKDLKRGSALNLKCRVCAQDSGVENSAGAVKALEEKKANAESRAAGATENLKVSELLFNFAWWMKKQGYAEATIQGRIKLLKRFIRLGADLKDPESVKEVIAKQEWSANRKVNAVDAYTSFLQMTGGKWDPPIYRKVQKLPFIPTESELDQLISGCSRRMATFLLLLKETGVRCGEACRLKWSDLDFVNRTVRVTPEKGGNPRILKLSSKLVSMLNELPKDGIRIFQTDTEIMRRNFNRQRRRIAAKLKNPRILQITFHTFRHWKATMEYYRTRDILHVKEMLGHKSLNSTLIYTQLINFDEDQYVAKVAHTEEEACRLIEVGFEYVCDFNGHKIFRKPK